ncbi:hypothetical protein CEXT_6141 [Caerostris extrusa]|uniref:Uncharacterized protein n=1 Tax=Caerostris extrusa TaxID=172846 RepID=A0AAV4VBW9_CAEEX|nr:hypothetical protein CEXT_6141 [Caerostris extrusa]
MSAHSENSFGLKSGCCGNKWTLLRVRKEEETVAEQPVCTEADGIGELASSADPEAQPSIRAALSRHISQVAALDRIS